MHDCVLSDVRHTDLISFHFQSRLTRGNKHLFQLICLFFMPPKPSHEHWNKWTSGFTWLRVLWLHSLILWDIQTVCLVAAK